MRFEVSVRFETEGDDSVVGVVGLIVQNLPSEINPKQGMDFSPWTYTTLNMEFDAPNALVALSEGVERARAGWELLGKKPLGLVSAQVTEPESEPEPSD